MAKVRKVIITCAVTGSIHTPSMSPHLPVTADEITDAALGAAEAGASVLHLHARNQKDGSPDQSIDAFMRFLPRIKQNTDAVVNITTGGAATMTIEQRLQPALKCKPEVASLNMGSMNFGLFPMLDRFKDLEYILTSCSDNNTRFEFECYDISHLYNLAHFLERGLVKPPLFVQSVFGILGGIGPHPEDLTHMKRTADRLFGNSYQWSILGAGRNQIPLAAMGAAMGANVRVGMEDSLWCGPGKMAESNAEQVSKMRQVLEGMSLEIATPDEAREILHLKGGDQVNF